MIRLTLLQLKEHLFQGMEGVTHRKTLPYFSLVQAQSGSYEIGLNEAPQQPATLFLTPPGALQTITHRMEPTTGKMNARWVFFELEKDGQSGEFRYDFSLTPRVEPLMEELFAATDECDRMSIGYRIVKELLADARPRQGREQELLPLMDYIKGHYTEKITVRQLAEQVHCSDSTLYALFKEAFGKSPIAWLNDYRLSVAAKLLKSTPNSIETVAQSVGIEDARYFSKLFRRRYQCTPAQYRKNTLL